MERIAERAQWAIVLGRNMLIMHNQDNVIRNNNDNNNGQAMVSMYTEYKDFAIIEKRGALGAHGVLGVLGGYSPFGAC